MFQTTNQLCLLVYVTHLAIVISIINPGEIVVVKPKRSDAIHVLVGVHGDSGLFMTSRSAVWGSHVELQKIPRSVRSASEIRLHLNSEYGLDISHEFS